jgi:hypothetical protein
MADLAFLDKLNKNQLEIADKIITKSQEMGVDPRLALSLAYVESNLNPAATSEKGAVGIMQVLPTTGEMLGVDRKKLRDVDTNIETGLRYLKQGLDRYKDPQLAAVGYNAGMDHPFLLGKSEKLPAESLKYVNKIYSFGGFSAPEVEPPAAVEAGAAAPESDLVTDIVNIAKAVPAATVAAAGNRPLPSDASTAAGVGSVAGSLIGAGTKTLAESSAAKSAASGTPVQNWAKSMGYGDRGAQTFGQAHQFEQGTRKGATIRNPASGQTYKPEFNFQKPPIVQPAPTMGQKVVGALDTAGGVMGKAPRLSGALAGAGVGFSGKDAAERYNRGDYLGAGIAGAGALGSAASMIPHPLTRGIGAGVGMLSPLALSVLDRLRDQPAQPQQ